MISQYANSPTLVKLENGLKEIFDDSKFVINWYDVIFNLKTATGYGLDVWGKILNRNREFLYNGTLYYLQGQQNIGGTEFTAQQMDDLYRKVLQMTAMRYIGNASINSINNMLNIVFGDQGRSYCYEYGTMQIRYVFEFYMNDLLKAIIETLNPHPSGVLTSFEYLPLQTYFGFNTNTEENQEQAYLPFDNGPFYG